MLGALINAALVAAGAIVGLFLKKGVPERISDPIMKGLGLCVAYIGISGALKGENTIVLIISMVLGAIVGTLIDIDGKVKWLGDKLQERFKSGGEARISEGFVTATVLFCAGAMAIVGPLESGLSGDHTTQITKGVIDLVCALIFASTMGAGVIFSSLSVFLYQGMFTLLAVWISPLLSEYAIAEMSCAGSVLLIGLSLNMLGVTKLKIMNYVPAVFFPILLCLIIK